MTQSLVTSALAELAATAQPGPAERNRARLLLVDYLAVAGTGASADSARMARDALLPRSAGPAPVLGTGRTAAVRDAALIPLTSAASRTAAVWPVPRTGAGPADRGSRASRATRAESAPAPAPATAR